MRQCSAVIHGNCLSWTILTLSSAPPCRPREVGKGKDSYIVFEGASLDTEREIAIGDLEEHHLKELVAREVPKNSAPRIQKQLAAESRAWSRVTWEAKT